MLMHEIHLGDNSGIFLRITETKILFAFFEKKNVVRAHHSNNVLGSSEKVGMTMPYLKMF